jgi:tetratricopeptide (TPR) repeat protein
MSPYLASCETEIARCALLRGNYDEAVEIAERAIARCADGTPERAQARLVSGLALTMSGRADDGVGVVSLAADGLAAAGSRLDAAQAWRDLAEALLHVGRSEQAIAALRRAADHAGARTTTIRAQMSLPLPVAD